MTMMMVMVQADNELLQLFDNSICVSRLLALPFIHGQVSTKRTMTV